MDNAFALVHTWPELHNAEYEVVQRILSAAANIGNLAVLIDNNGSILWAHPDAGLIVGAVLKRGDVAFVLSLHFESPRLIDFYSYYALWQPIDFYYDFGYQTSVDKFATHNDLISCDSDIADAHATNLFTGLGRVPEQPLPQMFHMVAEPYLPPNVSSESKLFYIGINWERLGGAKGRFHDTLTLLDNRGLTTIYGPETLHGVAPWEGFKTYEGELPFDGQSVLRAINRAGACLALSSGPHKRTGILSNRLFEGLAGGAAVIASPNPIIDRYFSDVVYQVDDSRGEAVLGQMITEAIREIRSDPKEATRRVLEGQEILRRHCSLEGSLRTLFRDNARRIAFFDAKFLDDLEITLVLADDYGDPRLLAARLQELRDQKRCQIDLHVVCDLALVSKLEAESATGALRSITIHGVDFNPIAVKFDGLRRPPERSGPAVLRALNAITTPFFALLSTNEVLFHDHFASLAKAINSNPKAQFAVSGALRQTRDGAGRLTRSLVEMRWTNNNSLFLVDGPIVRGRFLFRSSLAKTPIEPLMTLLDGEEVRYFQLLAFLAGPLAQTNYASYLHDEAVGGVPRPPSEHVEYQQQCIRDLFVRDARWLDLLSRGVGVPEFVFAYGPGTPIRWDEFKAPVALREPIESGRLLAVCVGGEGLPSLGFGFSQPELEFTWISSSRGIIDFRLPDEVIEKTQNFELVLVALGRRSAVDGREQHCLVLFNGMTCAYIPIPEERCELRIRIPRNLIGRNVNCRVELIPDHLEPVDSVGAGKDERFLSMALYSFGIVPVIMKQPTVLNPDIMYGCGLGSLGADTLVRSFYPSEAGLTWLSGLGGEIRFRTLSHVRRPLLKLRVWGRQSAKGNLQNVALALNGRSLGSFQLEAGQPILELPLPPLEPEELTYHFTINLAHAEGVTDGEGRIVDGRLLGLALEEIGIFDQLPSTE